MKKSSLIISIFIAFTLQVSAQVPDTLLCDAPDRDTTEAELLPWFGNNDYLEDFLDSIGYDVAGRIVGVDQVRYHVPVKFWVYRSTAGTGGPTIEELQTYIDNLNRFYNIDNDAKIGFYMKCDIGFINDDSHLEVGDTEASSLIQGRKESGCINVHITNDLKNSAGMHIRARFFGIDGIFLAATTYTNIALAATLSHEVGHYFELDHTH